MTFFRKLTALLIAIGCSLAVASSGAGEDKRPGSDDASIRSVVAYFAKNGVVLEKEKDSNYWVVSVPKSDGYEVFVAFRNWPNKTPETEMRAALATVNLAFLLNAPARVAMSIPGLRSTSTANKLPPPEKIPVIAKMQKLFKNYKPPKAGTSAGLPNGTR